MCSVLFCDVVGFTPLSEARDPEAVRELLSRYFGVARTVIGRYGGVVEKFIGDAVMAVWGTPVATEGDAERAVRAALDLVAAVAELGAEAGVPGLAARAGVVTGEVAVTLGAVGEGMVAGDAVNTAARVQAAAEPGRCWSDGATQRLAGGAVGFADAGEHALKGKAEPARLWRATRVLSAVGGAQRVDGLEAPLTGPGRGAAHGQGVVPCGGGAAGAAAGAGVRAGRGGQVPAGLGVREVRRRAGGEVWWHRGRCLSYGEGVAFWALAEIVRQRLGIAEEDPAEVAAGKLAAGLDRFVPDPGERAYVGARLGRLLGVAFAGDGGAALSREELFAGWRLFFERLAAERPVVLLVEDAQYADSGLLDFLDHLIDWVRDLPIYVLVFARPELGQARPGFGAGREPQHADPGPAGSGVDGPAGGRAGARACRPAARSDDHRPGAGHPAVRGGDGPLADRPGHRPAGRGGLPAGRRHRGAGGAGQPARAAGRPAGCPGPGGAAAGRRRRGAGHHLPRRGADRGVRAGRSRRCGPRWPSWCAARCCPCPPIRCPRSGAATASPRTCCARSPTTPCPAGTARPAT